MNSFLTVIFNTFFYATVSFFYFKGYLYMQLYRSSVFIFIELVLFAFFPVVLVRCAKFKVLNALLLSVYYGAYLRFSKDEYHWDKINYVSRINRKLQQPSSTVLALTFFNIVGDDLLVNLVPAYNYNIGSYVSDVLVNSTMLALVACVLYFLLVMTAYHIKKIR